MPTAVSTLKPLLTPQSDMVADVAGLAGVARVHRYNFYAFLNPFVFQERPKLIERPRIRTSALGFVSRELVGSVSNARQILNRNNGALRLGGFDDSLANVVVQPSLIALLSSRQPFQDIPHPTARGSCAFRDFCLERRSDLGKLISGALNRFTVPLLSVRSHGNISTSKIHPDNVIRLYWFRRFVFQLDMDVVLPVTVFTQLSRSRFTSFQLASLVVASINLDVFPAINQCQAYRPIFLTKREDSGIVICRCRLKRLDGLVLLLGSLAICSHTSAGSYSLIRTQLELLAQILIDLCLNRGLAGNNRFNSLIGIVAPIRERLQQSIDFRYLLCARLKLANYCQHLFHESKNFTCDYILFYTRIRGDLGRLTADKSACWFFLPALKRQRFQTYPLITRDNKPRRWEMALLTEKLQDFEQGLE